MHAAQFFPLKEFTLKIGIHKIEKILKKYKLVPNADLYFGIWDLTDICIDNQWLLHKIILSQFCIYIYKTMKKYTVNIK